MMEFFTKEIYEKRQIREYLLYPDLQEDLEEMLELYESDAATERNIFLEMKPLLLKHLPESLKSSVYDESIIPSKIPDAHLLSEITAWQKSIDTEWDVINIKYNKHCNSMKDLLTQNMFELSTEYSFYNAEILSIEILNDQVTLELDCSGCSGDQTNCTLTFTGCKLVEMPDNLTQNYWWLYEEIHMSDEDNFDFQVLLLIDGEFLSPSEFRVIADDVHIVILE